MPAEVVRVIDGDTLAVRARIWPSQFVETRVRLRGADAPETWRPGCEAERAAGRAAADFTLAWVGAADGVSLHDVDLGSFAGRVIARVERPGGEDLSQALIGAGLAVLAGEEERWCAARDEASR